MNEHSLLFCPGGHAEAWLVLKAWHHLNAMDNRLLSHLISKRAFVQADARNFPPGKGR